MSETTISRKRQFQIPKSLKDRALLIVDRRVQRQIDTRGFAALYSVTAGEELKAIENFPDHLRQILKRFDTIPKTPQAIVAVGGGSVGDFAGFVASVLKRGVEFHQVPTTWLAAIDSAHGGKTALNVPPFKNQVGTFYPAQSVFLVQDLLLPLPQARWHEGFFELAKVALLAGGSLYKKLSQEKSITPKTLWKLTPLAIEEKMKVVRRDPQETSGYRQILNLGHTVGHVIEGEWAWPHGLAVGLGLDFALRWSRYRELLSSKKYHEIQDLLARVSVPDLKGFKPIPKSRFLKSVKKDKKKKDQRIRFVFLKSVGSPVIETVNPEEIYQEWVRQKHEL